MREKEDERNLQITLTESGINIKPTLKAISDQVLRTLIFHKMKR